MLLALLFLSLFLSLSSAYGDTTIQEEYCDVVIIGGSTASLAAALTAAQVAKDTQKDLKICFTDPTDWPGGQMTASGVSAIDFGRYNSKPENNPLNFRILLAHMHGNPGKCWVSVKCYEPNWLVSTWVMPHLEQHKNLNLFLKTVAIKAKRDQNGKITSITAVQRTPKEGVKEWDHLLSSTVGDWYNPDDSALFTKKVIEFKAPVFIEGTEFGDVLLTSQIGVRQGVETPFENSTTFDSTCGQACTVPYYISLDKYPPKQHVPPGSGVGAPFHWQHPSTVPGVPEYVYYYTYRRSHVPDYRDAHTYTLALGDIAQMNWGGGNDFDQGYLFESLEDAKRDVKEGKWTGGLNRVEMSGAEQRAYGSYHWYKAQTPSNWTNHVALNYTLPGTGTGLSKMPYLRGTRRGLYGVNNFVLTYDAFKPVHSRTYKGIHVGEHFHDTVALGDYNDDIHRLNASVCTTPKYTYQHKTTPYYIPFRALTHSEVPNLLLIGKTMSQTFHANAATRLHPSEWSSGVAGGVAAVLMRVHNLTTLELYNNITMLQQRLKMPDVQQPLQWTW